MLLLVHCGNTLHAAKKEMRIPPRSSLVIRRTSAQDKIINNDPARNRKRRGTMNNMIERSSGLAAAGTVLTPKNFLDKQHLPSQTSIGTLYYYFSEMFFPDRLTRRTHILRVHGEPSRYCADQCQTGAASRRALSVSPFD
jgi:hypothetical protein